MEHKDIEIGKPYDCTRFGGEVSYPVEVVYKWEDRYLCVALKDGQAFYTDADRLSPHNLYADFKIDDLVMVRNGNADNIWNPWRPHHFAGVNEKGEALAWSGGCTSWTAEGESAQWDFCRKPTEEELQKMKGGSA